MFDMSNVEQFTYENTQQCFERMCAWINSGTELKGYLDVLKRCAVSHNEWAMENIHIDLFEKIRSKIARWLVPEEHILLYKNCGISSLEDEGIIITNKNIFYIKKLQIERLPLSKIYSIHGGGVLWHSGWYFNANRKIELTSRACSIDEQAVIMAMLCMLIKEQHQVGYKIKVYNVV